MSPLTQIILAPLVTALLILVLPRRFASLNRYLALAGTFIPLGVAFRVWLLFDAAPASHGGFRFVQDVPWVEDLGIHYLVGVDGINLGLILMAAVVAFSACWVSHRVQERTKLFYALILLMSAGSFGAFASLDLIFFYVFHELALVPTFILIGVWGRGERKDFAAFQMAIYLSFGALLVLAGLIAVYLAAGARSFSLPVLYEHVARQPMSATLQQGIMPVLLVGFGILVSLWPFYSWAPAGYQAAPTAAAMLHAGVLKKFGLYGLIRVALPILPEAAVPWMSLLACFALGNILYNGLVAMRQKDLTLLISHSSIAHVGFVFLGIASLTVIGVAGAIFIMVAHGLLAALGFGLSGYLYDQHGHVEMPKFGGLLNSMPFVGTALILTMLAGCGIPGFGNFVGELLVFFGAWQAYPAVTVAAVWGALIVAAVYMLRAVRALLHGTAPGSGSARDASTIALRLPFLLLLFCLIGLGCFPNALLGKIKPDVARLGLSGGLPPAVASAADIPQPILATDLSQARSAH